MPGLLTCNACNTEFVDNVEQWLHYRSEWHRYNLKRKVAGVPGVTETLFLARQSALAEEVDSEEGLVGETRDSSGQLKVGGNPSNDDMDEDEAEFEDLDPSSCFMCDLKHRTIETCMVHMHKHHGFFIPDIEYLKDPKGLITYLGLKVKRDFICLYCNERCHPFSGLEAVRKHMEAKGHCKVHYGDGSEDEEAELEEFYDYSSSYVAVDGKQLVAVNDTQNAVELGNAGSELIITSRNGGTTLTKMLGSREYLRYYRQKPSPTPANSAITAALASRYKNMGLTTVQSRENAVRLKVMKAMSRSDVEAMRSKIGMKSNVIRNLPSNVPY